MKENSKPRRLAILTKTQAVDNPTPHNPKTQRRKTHTQCHPITKQKIAGTNNQWSLISLNINSLNSTIKRHMLTE